MNADLHAGGPADLNASGMTVAVEISSPIFAAPMLRRLVMAVAACSNLSLDRANDAALAAELLAHATGQAPDGYTLNATVTGSAGGLIISVGPLADGAGGELLRASGVPDVGSVVERVADTVWIDNDEQGEYLHVRVGVSGTVDAATIQGV